MSNRMMAGIGKAAAVVSLMWIAGCATPPPIPVVPSDTLSIVPEPRDGNWMKRHESFNQLALQGGADVVFIGDSITQGWEGGGKDVWAEAIAPFKAANFGISGDRTEHVIWRLKNGNLGGKLRPKAFVVMIGTNNTGHRKDKPELIAAGVGDILRILHDRYPRAKILLLGIFPRGAKPDDPARVNNAAANALLSKFDGHWNIRYLDIGNRFLEADGTLPKNIMPDLLHLSPAGYKIWADAIVPEIKAALAK